MASSKKTSAPRKLPAKSADDIAGRRGRSGAAKYPRHSLAAALRIPRAILDQNAGKEATLAEVAGFIGVKSTSGPFNVEIGSATKFGLLDRPSSGRLRPSELAKKILRPQDPRQELQGYREAVMLAPQIADVYNHYRGENLPDDKFFANALTDKFGLPAENVAEFKSVFIDTLETAQLLARHNDKIRIVDVSGEEGSAVPPSQDRLEKLGKAVKSRCERHVFRHDAFRRATWQLLREDIRACCFQDWPACDSR
ncbi:MAG TPA: hypothetical protein VGQ36_06515 [Thermoanaerobaculia bacterium]|jgi:hypothetical protein|nr:hypothetical protein [Thermoanaerobaculia bacterium]